MAYIDTSIIVAYYCPEPLSEKAERAILAEQEPVISSLTAVEFVSALARKVREKGLSRSDAKKILDQFSAHRSQGYYIEKTLEPVHYAVASELIAEFKTPLRALDALHLAVASKSGITLITADMNFARSGEQLGIQVIFIR